MSDDLWRFNQPRTVTADVLVQNEGTIVLLRPLNDTADEWLDEHLDPDCVRSGFGYPVEPRYVEPIIDGLQEAGFKVGAR